MHKKTKTPTGFGQVAVFISLPLLNTTLLHIWDLQVFRDRRTRRSLIFQGSSDRRGGSAIRIQLVD